MTRSDLRTILHVPVLAVWCLFVFMIPFYFLPSGLPQPGDVLVFVLVPVVLAGWNGRLNRLLSSAIRPLLWFTLWVCLINYGWALVAGKWTALKAYTIFPLYYIFNAAVFSTGIILYQRFGQLILRITLDCVVAAVMVQVTVAILARGQAYRDALFFNNANQLGYYALLAASLMAMAQRKLRIGLLKTSVVLLACAYLALLSASRSAVAGIAILFFLLVFQNPKIIIVASLAAVGLVTLGPVAQAIETVEQRVHRDRHMTFAEERGYDRMWKYKEYMIIGAGEGDVNRFNDNPRQHGREIHSSIATVLFSYGIVGITLFMWFVVRIVRGAPIRTALMLLPTLAQTVAHQGMRFTMLWVLLAFFVALKMPGPVLGKLAPPEPTPTPA